MARRVPLIRRPPLPVEAFPYNNQPPWGNPMDTATPLPGGHPFLPGVSTSPPVSGMPAATPPTGVPQPMNPRQLPPGTQAGWEVDPTPHGNPEMPGVPPTQPGPYIPPGTPGLPNLTWKNRTSLSPINWLPPEFREDSPDYNPDYARQFRESLGDPTSEMGAQSWNLLGQYLTNSALAYMNPLDAQTSLDWLSTYGSPEFTEAYRDTDVGFGTPPPPASQGGADPALAALVPGAQADAFYNRADRWDTIERGWDTARDTLFGGVADASGWENDGNTDAFEAADNWMRQVIETGRDYGLEEGQQQRSRWQERDYQNRLQELAQLGNGLDENVYNLGIRLLNPSNYSAAQSPMQFRLGTYSSMPASGSGYNANYGYRNTRRL
jgi:hypothetical protein